MKSLPEELSPQRMLEGLRAFGPVAPVPESEQALQRRTIARGNIHLILANLVESVRSGRRGRGSSDDVTSFYRAAYATPAARFVDEYGGAEKPRLFRLGPRAVVKAEPSAVAHFMTRCLGDIVSACEPSSVCEVGCGRGRNLMHVAGRLPQAQCTGFDISENAIASANELQRMDNLAETKFGKAYGLEPGGLDNVKRIEFRIGSAFALPAADRSFDLVYTTAALEQMHNRVGEALSELRRVSRQHVLMREPFVDGNDALGRVFLWSKNYFRMKVADLGKHGLEPVRVWTEFPRKVTFGYSFVLCRVA